MQENVKLYRKRLIPNETVLLKDDVIVSMDDSLILTSWKALKPRKDIATGISAYYRKEGYKISRVANAAGNLVYWYCDIIEESGDMAELTYTDLLIDVVIYPDGSVRVLDLKEAADAFQDGLITQKMLTNALSITDRLLSIIYSGGFPSLTACIETYLDSICEIRRT